MGVIQGGQAIEGGLKRVYENAGSPSSGTAGTYAGEAPVGALLADTTNGVLYTNTGTKASPTWSLLLGVITSDNTLVRLGTDGDQVLVSRSATLNADTALTSVIVGTPQVAAIPANSLIISNVTADGDQVFVGQTGGNSIEWARYDASAGLVVFNEDSADADFRIESNDIASMFVIDGGLNVLAIGAAVPTNPQAFVAVLPQAVTATANQSYHRMQILSTGGAVTVPAGTAPIVAALNIHEPNITATGTVTDACTLRVVDAPTEGSRNYALWVDAGATRLDGTVYIGDTDNATVTQGLTVNQGAADDSVLEFKSSDIAHATTTVTEADTFALFMKHHATAGGIRFTGIATGAVIAQQIRGIGTEDTTDAPTTTSLATLNLNGYIISTNTVTGHQATGNLLNVQSNSVNEFIVKGDGEIYSNQSATVGTFDDFDDALMCADLSYVLSREYGKVVEHNRPLFERLGILGPLDEHGGGMFSVTKLNMLCLCAIGQLGAQLKEAAVKITGLQQELAAVAAGVGRKALEGG